MGNILKLIILLSIPAFSLGQIYNSLTLNCSSDIITLPCSYYPDQRAGTIKLKYYPKENCTTTIKVDNSSRCFGASTYAIYFNVKVLSLERNDSVEIYENGTLVKYLPGGPHPTYRSVTSVAQLLSAWKREPTLELRFNKKSNWTWPVLGDYLTLEYVVLRNESNPILESRCPGLQYGALPNEYYCDPSSDHVTCPINYFPMVGLNPASFVPEPYTLDYCLQLYPRPYQPFVTRPTSRPNPNYNYGYSRYTSSLDTYQIVFVVFLSIALFIALLRLCVFCFCRGTPVQRNDRQSLVVNEQGQRTGSVISGSYLGAPPSYDTVCPQGGPSQDAPKY
ncbi:hypothetical protein BV898_03201 [Hypsibius exemplaris]|uniref:CUB domain-containing protein n=1 Tax=Hypsibius exemplaris TaxID=2072580 RepID=A0A1W0X5W9_HYPEX|nr:hypothetical protein BV898_03201 [Hypsibius exemplaris]